MQISPKVMDKIIFSLVMLFLLSPLTVFGQGDMIIVPVVVNKLLKNVITVSKANGKFADPVAAVHSITHACETNPYLVVICPGVYMICQTLIMKPYGRYSGREYPLGPRMDSLLTEERTNDTT